MYVSSCEPFCSCGPPAPEPVRLCSPLLPPALRLQARSLLVVREHARPLTQETDNQTDRQQTTGAGAGTPHNVKGRPGIRTSSLCRVPGQTGTDMHATGGPGRRHTYASMYGQEQFACTGTQNATGGPGRMHTYIRIYDVEYP